MSTQEHLRELFDYREDGRLIWKTGRRLGKVAGCNRGDGYWIVCGAASTPKLLHRLIYLWHHGQLPREIDHIDRNPSNNRIENLREATHAENTRNTSKQAGASSRFKGVGWHAGRKKWRAYIGKKHIGLFDSEINAATAYNLAAYLEFGEFAALNGEQQ